MLVRPYLTVGGHDDDHAMALCREPSDRPPGQQHFIVRMSMKRNDRCHMRSLTTNPPVRSRLSDGSTTPDHCRAGPRSLARHARVAGTRHTTWRYRLRWRLFANRAVGAGGAAECCEACSYCVGVGRG